MKQIAQLQTRQAAERRLSQGCYATDYCPEPSEAEGEAEGDGEGEASDSEVVEVFVSEVEELFSEGEGEAVVLVEAFFLVVVVDEVSEVPVLFFLAVAEVELLAVVDFLVVAVADAFFPPAVLAVVVWVEVLAEADSLLCAQEVTKATPTRRVMKEKTVFFIGLCKGAQTVQPPPKPQAYSLA